MTQPASERLIALTFDDAVSNHATFAAPLLQSLGFAATFFICEFEGKGTDRFELDKRQYMTWEQIAGLHRAGFEIGNHTRRHTVVKDLPESRLRGEISYIEDRCREHGIPRPETFAYPVGIEDPSALPTLRSMGYRLARLCGDTPYSPAKHDPLLIPSFVITDETDALFETALQQARDGQVSVLTYHGVPEHTHPWVNTAPERFERQMRRLAAEKFRVVAFRELAQLP